MSIRIFPTTSIAPQTCWQCANLGLPPFGISAGEEHFLVVAEETKEPCCSDCFERLAEQASEVEA